MADRPTIVYTYTDEAPALATRSLLPILRAFAAPAGVPLELRDISLAGRILAAFPDHLPEGKRVPDALAELGRLALTPEANIIKLPNVSASLPQLKAAVKELQGKGFPLPEYPDEPKDDGERAVKARYDRVKGSAVNPVLREGNSDRRAPKAVKEYARKHPHRMGPWSKDSRTHVATMGKGDFRANEKSVTLAAATKARIEHVAAGGAVTVLRDGLALEEGEILDGTFMDCGALRRFLEEEMEDAREKGVLFSLHLKATMMKVSDPILFGHAVRAYFRELFAAHGATLERIGADPDNGLGDVLAKVKALPEAERRPLEEAVAAALARGPALAMVNSAKGITNLHVPSDVIIDASMPPLVRDSGRMWNAKGELQDTKACIPDSSYAGVYRVVVEDCRRNGALDPATMGSVPNVGLMARAAEEYGSHDKTFRAPADGTIRVVDAAGKVLIEHRVAKGDVWRACQTKDAPVRDWVKLAVTRARASATPAIFWLDRTRAHDAEVIRKVEATLPALDAKGLDLRILPPEEAVQASLDRIRRGEDTISVTGNVLRDYLTDLFPILEVGTSARMLSIVPLMAGGGLFETGAGGSAPKHVQQFTEEGHLRWDSLGEFLALTASFEHYAERTGNAGARILGETLDRAVAVLLDRGIRPSGKARELDNRGTHVHLARHWAAALASQEKDPALAKRFAPVAAALEANEGRILAELAEAAGRPVDIGGYYRPDVARTDAAMRPSATFNGILAGV
jgi:isocitrate dehydrogenase